MRVVGDDHARCLLRHVDCRGHEAVLGGRIELERTNVQTTLYFFFSTFRVFFCKICRITVTLYFAYPDAKTFDFERFLERLFDANVADEIDALSEGRIDNPFDFPLLAFSYELLSMLKFRCNNT